MPKTILKEIIIMLLLLLAIVFALGVLFYDYIPISKIVPVVEKYQTSNTVLESLQNDILADTTKVIVTREIDGTDLSVYEQAKDYKKGKANPFESVVTNNTTTTTGKNQVQSNGSSETTNKKNNTNINSNTTDEASDENDYLSNTSRNNGSK